MKLLKKKEGGDCLERMRLRFFQREEEEEAELMEEIRKFECLEWRKER